MIRIEAFLARLKYLPLRTSVLSQTTSIRGGVRSTVNARTASPSYVITAGLPSASLPATSSVYAPSFAKVTVVLQMSSFPDASFPCLRVHALISA